jgi:hypothetical protein
MMIGSLQWAVSLGRFDIQAATMTMSWFRAAPRQGPLDRLKRMYGYLRRYASAAIHVCVEEPDFSELPDQEFDWCETVSPYWFLSRASESLTSHFSYRS